MVDYQMPRMNGVELVDCLRKRSVAFARNPHHRQGERRRSQQRRMLGFRQVLEKPLDDDALLDSIRSALSMKG